MALVKYGGGVSQMSGKLGGTVAARNKAGAYLRNWAFPTNTPTPIQTTRRANFAGQSNAWKGLTETDRDAWNDQATGQTDLNRLGEAYTPSGRQFFMSCALNLDLVGIPIGSMAPPTVSPPTIYPLQYFFPTASSGHIHNIMWDPQYSVSNTAFVVYAAPQQTGGKRNLTLLYRLIGVYIDPATLDLTPDYIAVFPDICTAGAQWFFKLRVIDTATGLSSPWLIRQAEAT